MKDMEELLIYGLAVKWHLERVERRAFWLACLAAFLFGAFAVENIALAYFCQNKAYNSAKNTADYGSNDSGARSNFNKTSFENECGQSCNRPLSVGKHGELVVFFPFEVSDDLGVVGNFKTVDELLNFGIHMKEG